MKKDVAIGISVLVILVLGVWLYITFYHPQALGPTTAYPLPAGHYTENAQYYTIAANYPTSTPLSASVSAAADAAAVLKMQTLMSGIIEQFKTDGNFDKLTPRDISMMGFDQGKKESLQIMYLIASSPRTVSYIFTIYADTLGAHPNTDFATITFDTTTGQALALGDLFQDGSDYLTQLSTSARQILPTQLGTTSSGDFINPGTTPDATNFKSFFFDNKDFVILFPPYQVAPYASGPQTLRIPVTQLDAILKPEYQQ